MGFSRSFNTDPPPAQVLKDVLAWQAVYKENWVGLRFSNLCFLVIAPSDGILRGFKADPILLQDALDTKTTVCQHWQVRKLSSAWTGHFDRVSYHNILVKSLVSKPGPEKCPARSWCVTPVITEGRAFQHVMPKLLYSVHLWCLSHYTLSAHLGCQD